MVFFQKILTILIFQFLNNDIKFTGIKSVYSTLETLHRPHSVILQNGWKKWNELIMICYMVIIYFKHSIIHTNQIFYYCYFHFIITKIIIHIHFINHKNCLKLILINIIIVIIINITIVLHVFIISNVVFSFLLFLLLFMYFFHSLSCLLFVFSLLLLLILFVILVLILLLFYFYNINFLTILFVIISFYYHHFHYHH